jgi:hypothetical protein
VDPRPFAIGITLAASCSFITPLEPSCVLVYGPGHYRFTDFFRLGTPLTALMVAALVVLVPIVYPFEQKGGAQEAPAPTARPPVSQGEPVPAPGQAPPPPEATGGSGPQDPRE